MCNWGRVRFAHPPGPKSGRLYLRATRFFVRKTGAFSPCARRSRTAEESLEKAHMALCKRRFMAWRCLMARRLLLHSADEARLADTGGNALAEQGDIFGGDVACKGKTQGAACGRGIDAHGGEDVRWFGGAG